LPDEAHLWYRLATALGIGLLIGVERERRKGGGPERHAAGVRTFALASVAGAVSLVLGGVPLLAVTTGGAVVLAAVAYHKTPPEDPGLTTESAFILTPLLGALSMRMPAVAAATGVAVAILLFSRSRLHRFATTVLTREELTDALLLGAATLIILPLVPDRHVGPFDAINPYATWIIVILVLAISAAGHVALRLLGPRFGLAVVGLASGFVSSVAAIAEMASRAAREGALMRPAVAGAVLSNVATVILMVIVLAATSLATLRALALPLAFSGTATIGYGALHLLRNLRGKPPGHHETGRAFSVKTAVIFALTVSAVLFAGAALDAWFGAAGILAAATVSGFANAHAAAISVASLVVAGRIEAHAAVVPILAALTTNTATKLTVALINGNWAFARKLAPGLALLLASAWIGWGFSRML